ncbi:MAG: adenylyl-sulfate kinase [Lentimicrobiaceae bacterium]|jgi:adenylylsulfate kinase|nr:adenylyl-sulfate kinase [Lentimicrobiaceae bacterium]MDG1902574.1 adenylyl-sulfate kinase [Bacteroidales bacterium]MDG2080434.1 adenylyl-sulfate kinase [Bacteroidales bacterium]|tara:strand:+ start:274 stop:870 length:597 start_codon:yes stop_codon:yes gene_type:complete
MSQNIHPVFDKVLSREDKEKLLNQHAIVVWMTGLSGAGKTTIASNIAKQLNKLGYLTQILDGDNIRTGINNNLGFSEQDRYENIRRISEVSKLFLDCGIVCINSFISPTNEIRNMAKEIIGEDNLFEVFVDSPIEVCEQRDIKGLYKKARAGKIKNFTGIDSPFEIPSNPSLVLNTSEKNVEVCVQELLEKLLPIIKY